MPKIVVALMKEYLLFMFKRADAESFVKALKLAARYSGMGSFEFEREGSIFRLVVHHNFGKKHSIYVGAALDEAVRTIVRAKPKTEITDISVLLEFEILPSFQPVKGAESLASVASMT